MKTYRNGDHYVAEGKGPRRYIIAEGMTRAAARANWQMTYMEQCDD